MAIARLLRRLSFTTCITHPPPMLHRPLLSNVVRFTTCITHPPPLLHGPLLSNVVRFTTCITHPPPLQHRPLLSNVVRLDRCTSTVSAASKNPLGFVSTYGDWDLTRAAMLYPGMDYEHWNVFMQQDPAGRGATKDQFIDCCIKTLAKVVGSEEEAKKRIYKVSFGRMLTLFGCQLDWETAYKLEELPEVSSVAADCYVDPQTKDYGGELLVDGKIVQRSTGSQIWAYVLPVPRLIYK